MAGREEYYVVDPATTLVIRGTGVNSAMNVLNDPLNTEVRKALAAMGRTIVYVPATFAMRMTNPTKTSPVRRKA